MPTKKSGRPSKLSTDLQEKLCGLISRGHYATTACAAVGLGEATYFRWMELGVDHLETRNGKRTRIKAKSPFKEFREAVERAKAQAQMFAMEAIRDAAFDVVAGPNKTTKVRAKNWTAAAWFLERTAPNQFARREVQHQVPGDTVRNPDTPAKKIVRFGGRYKQDGTLQTSAGPPAPSSKSPSTEPT